MDTSKSISLGQAFAHCASTSSYWICMALAIVLALGCIVVIARIQRKTEVNPYVKNILAFICLALIVASIFLRPCTVAQNTSVDAAARGHYLGY